MKIKSTLYSKGTKLKVISTHYRSPYRTEGAVVTSAGVEDRGGRLMVYLDGSPCGTEEWFYRYDELKPLTKLEQILR